jgi:hypothetical protein
MRDVPELDPKNRLYNPLLALQLEASLLLMELDYAVSEEYAETREIMKARVVRIHGLSNQIRSPVKPVALSVIDGGKT